MKIKLLVLCGMLFATIAAAQQKKFVDPNADSRGYLVKLGDKAPDDYELVLHDGTKTNLKALRGKVVILQFTASWCKVCREEMPYLEKDIWQAHRDKGVLLIGVDRDEPLETVKKFHKDMEITYPLALDPEAKIFRKFADQKAGVTRNVVIDRDGYIRFLTRLYDKEEFGHLVAKVKELSEKVSK